MPTNEPLSNRPIIGQTVMDLAGRIRLIDDAESISAAVQRHGLPLDGVFVPVCLHDPGEAESAFDAAQRAAELLSDQPGCRYVIVPFLPRPEGDVFNDGSEPFLLQPARWNHAMALARGLRTMAEGRNLVFHLNETINGSPSSEFDPAASINYVLDTAGLRYRGWVPRRLAPTVPSVVS